MGGSVRSIAYSENTAERKSHMRPTDQMKLFSDDDDDDERSSNSTPPSRRRSREEEFKKVRTMDYETPYEAFAKELNSKSFSTVKAVQEKGVYYDLKLARNTPVTEGF